MTRSRPRAAAGQARVEGDIVADGELEHVQNQLEGEFKTGSEHGMMEA
jgi:hypothetical protein